ncbi:alpha/beta hydrolase family protein [Hyphomonas sp.]|uniref:alpha/beta hydrolase family protein n=1 Tax=Hyphomonas sp. TaxID=87 RepID=UPI003919103C
MKLKTLVSACCALVLGAAAPALAEPLKVDDYARYPLVSGISMSLEGDMLVGLVADTTRDGREQAAAMWDLSGEIDTTRPLVATRITPHNGRMRFFGTVALKQGRSLWFARQEWTGRLGGCGEGRVTGATRTFVTKVYMGDRTLKIDDMPGGSRERVSEETRRCLEMNNTTGLVSIMASDPENIIINRLSLRDGERYFKHNLRTGREELLFTDSGSVRVDRVDPVTGMPISKTELDPAGGEYRFYVHLIDQRTGQFVRQDPLTNRAADRFQVSVLKREEDGRYFILTDKFSDKAAIYLYDPASQSFESEPVFAHPEFNATGLVTSTRTRDFGEIVGFRYAAAQEMVYWIDGELSSIQQGLAAAYPGQNVSINSYNNDMTRVLFTVSSSTMPPAYFLLVDKSRVAVIGASRPWIRPETLRETELVYYDARDGLSIPALITKPRSLEPGQKARGAVIVPHGGPWARDYANWDPTGWTQFLASRGFIVLQPQYRGSTGWGRELWLAGDGEWGQKMQDDKDDGAAWLVEQGLVDADKIAIFGYSYGGFAAMAAVVRPDSPYQCAIAGAGVSNLTRIGNNWSDNRLQRAFQGHTVKGMDPARNTEKANIPILVYHGDRDVRVPLFHGVDFYNAVRAHQPQSELLVVADMPHSMPWYPEHHTVTLNAVDRFLSTTCGL